MYVYPTLASYKVEMDACSISGVHVTVSRNVLHISVLLILQMISHNYVYP